MRLIDAFHEALLAVLYSVSFSLCASLLSSAFLQHCVRLVVLNFTQMQAAYIQSQRHSSAKNFLFLVCLSTMVDLMHSSHCGQVHVFLFSKRITCLTFL